MDSYTRILNILLCEHYVALRWQGNSNVNIKPVPWTHSLKRLDLWSIHSLHGLHIPSINYPLYFCPSLANWQHQGGICKDVAGTEAFCEANSTACAQVAQFHKMLGTFAPSCNWRSIDECVVKFMQLMWIISSRQMCEFWIPGMCSVNSSKMGFSRAVFCTSQPKLMFWSEIWGMKVSQQTASYSPSSVRYTSLNIVSRSCPGKHDLWLTKAPCPTFNQSFSFQNYFR